MPTTLIRKDASSLLRTKIVRDDANDFEKTESSSGAPLKIKTSTNLTLDDKRYLSLDASLRKSETRTDDLDETGLIPPGYVIPEGRVIRHETLDEAFIVRNEMAVQDFLGKAYSLYPELIPEGVTIEPLVPAATLADLAMPVKSLDFSIDIKNIFSQLDDVDVVYVEAPNDPYVTCHIIGKATDGLVIACTLLVQT
ncbi:hypothetical protein [Nodularia spumigena]|uniref:hypothetical protein n=1 Tax=Nodularia spumigena TaxID=70799 RepID=UPI00232F32BD|nr:hypothetical protein [Nodularia spumigena]MDB9316297.1 hypothetical protein [Nodularia spumigena CS-590/01A]MDB9337114.1 hypothetical protein [Nodularia spumigena CS-590/01]